MRHTLLLRRRSEGNRRMRGGGGFWKGVACVVCLHCDRWRHPPVRGCGVADRDAPFCWNNKKKKHKHTHEKSNVKHFFVYMLNNLRGVDMIFLLYVLFAELQIRDTTLAMFLSLLKRKSAKRSAAATGRVATATATTTPATATRT